MNTVNVKIIEGGVPGLRNLVFSVFLQSDGVSGELTKYTIMDPVLLGLKRTDRFSLYRMDYNFAGFDAIVEFDSGGVVPTYKWTLVEGTNTEVDFHKTGGVRDDSGVDGTGKLMLSTQGFTSSQDSGSILFKLRMP